MENRVLGVLVNDLHIDKDNSDLIKSIFSQLIGVCKKYNTKKIFCGGDVFTNRSGQPLKCLTDFKEALSMVSSNSLELHAIAGNHDKTDSDDEKSYLDVYSDPCFYLYRSGSTILCDNALIAFIPYFRGEKWILEYEKVLNDIKNKEKIGKIDKSTSLILITHTDFDGAENNDGTKVSSPIAPSLFKKWNVVLSGHYHNASKLSSKVFYTGSAYQNNFGENITDKGFTVVYEDGSTKFVNSTFPKYIKEVIKSDDKESLKNLLEKYEGEKRDHIRFVFTGKKEECQKINLSEINNKYGIDCKFICNEEKEAIEISESENVLTYDKKAIEEDFLTFCKSLAIEGDNFEYGKKLIKEVTRNVEPN